MATKFWSVVAKKHEMRSSLLDISFFTVERLSKLKHYEMTNLQLFS